MARILTPGIALLGRLRYRNKFLLIYLFFIAPLFLVSLLLLMELQSRLDFQSEQHEALHQLQHLRVVSDHLQRHRGMSTALIAGEQSFRAPLHELGQQLQQQIDRLASQPLASLPAAELFLAGWSELRHNLLQRSAEDNLAMHTALLSRLAELAMQLSSEHRLALDPHLASNYLSALLVTQLPQLTEVMGQSRAQASAMLSSGRRPPAVLQQLGINSYLLEQNQTALQRSLDEVYRHNPALRDELYQLGEAAAEAVAGFNELLRELVQSEYSRLSSEQLFNSSTLAIERVYAVYDSMLPLVEGLVQQQQQRDSSLRALTLFVMLSVLLMLLYLFIAFYQDIMSTVGKLQLLSKQLGSGDLRQRCQVDSQDELAEVAHSLNSMADEFEGLIHNVVSSISQLAAAAEELSMVTTETAEGVARQRAETEQIVSAVTELSSAAREVAGNTQLAADSADQASERARYGRELLGEALDKVNVLVTEINSANTMIQALAGRSDSIGKVMDVINDIAEQTALLSLNAAIEAARAGESGRGFAVVADEVRALAGRTRISTEEIRQMIEALQADTKQAVDVNQRGLQQSADTQILVDSVCDSLTGILQVVTAINDMTAQIAAATEEQTAVVEDISRSMLVISESVDRSALASEQTAESSQGLAELAQQLMLLTNRFQLGRLS